MYLSLFIALGEFGVKELLLIGIIAIPIYFLPSIIAFSTYRRNKVPILLINLLLGWTTVGWIASLIWACIPDKDPNIVITNSQTSNIQSNPSTGVTDSEKKMDLLRSLKDLHSSGVLSDDEFEKEKAKVLGGDQ